MISYISNSKMNKANKFFFNEICYEISKLINIKKCLFFELSIIDDFEMQNICKNYYKNKKTTDVLSFPSDEITLKSSNFMGEVFINNDKVILQAKKYEHTYDREICFLFTHGILHLLGYDHQNKDEEKKMFDIQKEILKKINIDRD
ncbi:MAG: rRNA maturation RNase YbeY [Mycoplasmoidaceae bacterium]